MTGSSSTTASPHQWARYWKSREVMEPVLQCPAVITARHSTTWR